MKLYTRTGDQGQTGLFGGPRVSKAAPRVEAYGDVDELNSLLGVIRIHARDLAPLDDDLGTIQGELFSLGADLATPAERRTHTPRISPEDATRLEGRIDFYQEAVPPQTRFVLPGGNPAASFLHLARTVCRRAERRVVELHEHPDSLARGPADFLQPLIYLNRLSDLLFAMARWANHQGGGVTEVFWDPPANPKGPAQGGGSPAP